MTIQQVQQLDFEFVLFASAIIDYDYIMALIARYTQAKPGKQKMTREQLIGLIESDAKFMDEREDITAYINTPASGRRAERKRDPRRLRSLQSRKERPPTGRDRRKTRTGKRRAANLCGWYHAAHDL